MAEEFGNHDCSIGLKKTVTIEVDYISQGVDKDGRKNLIAKSLNGTLIIMKEVPKSEVQPIPFSPTTPEQPDRNNREANNTIILVELHYRAVEPP